ncbi:MAG: hypothetical protein ACFBSG_02390 [Leptolyngbyaceae cyanobacterium]
MTPRGNAVINDDLFEPPQQCNRDRISKSVNLPKDGGPHWKCLYRRLNQGLPMLGPPASVTKSDRRKPRLQWAIG